MTSTIISKSCKLPDGREITVETGKLARQADGSVVLRMGNTMILATVVSRIEAVEGADFLPLSVDYQEKFAATGKIPGGFLKRESRLSDYEILISRLVDRAIRPLFPEDYHSETQVNIQLISGDHNALPDSLAAFAASAALSVAVETSSPENPCGGHRQTVVIPPTQFNVVISNIPSFCLVVEYVQLLLHRCVAPSIEFQTVTHSIECESRLERISILCVGDIIHPKYRLWLTETRATDQT